MIENIARVGIWGTVIAAILGVLAICAWVVLWPIGYWLESAHMPPFGNPLGWLAKGFVTYLALEFFFLSLGACAHRRPHSEV